MAEQTVELTDDELRSLVFGSKVTKGGWTFGEGGLDSAFWDAALNGTIEDIQWSDHGVRVVRADEQETEGSTMMELTDDERAEMAAKVFAAFENAEGQDRQRLQQVLNTLGYNIRTNHELYEQ